MGKSSKRARLAGSALLAWVALAASPTAAAAELKQKTIDAFNRYVQLTEARLDSDLLHGNPFLWVDGLPSDRREAANAQLGRGEVVVERLETHENERPIKVPDGMIHHWMGVVFIPGTTLERTMALVTDYDNHQNVYQPDVMRSKLLRHNGDDYQVYLRFYKKKVVTAVLNTEHDVHYVHLNATHAYSRSYTTRIAEVEDPGQPDEREKPVGNDRGFLWRLNSYWRFEEKDGGVYVQCEAVSLTRDVPAGLGWLIGPFIKSVPKESLLHTLTATRVALVTKPAAQ